MPSFRTHKSILEEEFSTTPATLWELLGDTNRLNHAIGLPGVVFEPFEKGAFSRTARARWNGLRLKWEEFPFDWIMGRQYSVLREFEEGPFKTLRGGIELLPGATGTRVRVFAELTPRSRLGALLAFFVARQSCRRILKCCRFLASLTAEVPARPAPTKPGRFPKLKPAVDELKTKYPVSTLAVEALAEHLMTTPDHEVRRMRPHELAERWRIDREAVLRTFLYAAQDGVLQLDWELMCPNCRVPKAEFRSLKDLNPKFHCDLCGVDYTTDMDRFTELRFSVNPEYRPAIDEIFCVGGPSSSPHILVQGTLLPGEAKEFELPALTGSLRCRVYRHNHTCRVSVVGNGGPGAGRPRLVYTPQGWETTDVIIPRGQGTITWWNRSQEPIVAVLENTLWDERAVTAAVVSVMPEFRRLFGSEVLAPGVQVGIRDLSVLFTDLKRSTALYESVGDATAYGCVRRHFDYIAQIVEKHRGVILKTMGDAVMAAFASAGDMTRAAIAIQRGVGQFNSTLPVDSQIEIKLGMHRGPAICVSANGQLDYFGRTVNMAARIQNQSLGGDIWMSQETYQDADVQGVLRQQLVKVESRQTELKGLGGEFTLYRVHPAAEAEEESRTYASLG